jgi:hypothetical protein
MRVTVSIEGEQEKAFLAYKATFAALAPSDGQIAGALIGKGLHEWNREQDRASTAVHRSPPRPPKPRKSA